MSLPEGKSTEAATAESEGKSSVEAACENEANPPDENSKKEHSLSKNNGTVKSDEDQVISPVKHVECTAALENSEKEALHQKCSEQMKAVELEVEVEDQALEIEATECKPTEIRNSESEEVIEKKTAETEALKSAEVKDTGSFKTIEDVDSQTITLEYQCGEMKATEELVVKKETGECTSTEVKDIVAEFIRIHASNTRTPKCELNETQIVEFSDDRASEIEASECKPTEIKSSESDQMIENKTAETEALKSEEIKNTGSCKTIEEIDAQTITPAYQCGEMKVTEENAVKKETDERRSTEIRDIVSEFMRIHASNTRTPKCELAEAQILESSDEMKKSTSELKMSECEVKDKVLSQESATSLFAKQAEDSETKTTSIQIKGSTEENSQIITSKCPEGKIRQFTKVQAVTIGENDAGSRTSDNDATPFLFSVKFICDKDQAASEEARPVEPGIEVKLQDLKSTGAIPKETDNAKYEPVVETSKCQSSSSKTDITPVVPKLPESLDLTRENMSIKENSAKTNIASFEFEDHQRKSQELGKRFPKQFQEEQESYLYRGQIKKHVEVSGPDSIAKRSIPIIIDTDVAFQVILEIPQFQKENISVNIVGDMIDIYGKQVIETRYGEELHEIHQIIPIPKYVDDSNFTACVKQDNRLYVEAPVKKDAFHCKNEKQES